MAQLPDRLGGAARSDADHGLARGGGDLGGVQILLQAGHVVVLLHRRLGLLFALEVPAVDAGQASVFLSKCLDKGVGIGEPAALSDSFNGVPRVQKLLHSVVEPHLSQCRSLQAVSSQLHRLLYM